MFFYSLLLLAGFAFALRALTHPRLERQDCLKEILSGRKWNDPCTNIWGWLKKWQKWHDQFYITILLFGADSHSKTNGRVYKPALLFNTGPALLTYSRGSYFSTGDTPNSRLCVNTYFLYFFTGSSGRLKSKVVIMQLASVPVNHRKDIYNSMWSFFHKYKMNCY